MLDEIDGKTFLEWIAFLSIEPEEMSKQKHNDSTFESIMAARYGDNR